MKPDSGFICSVTVQPERIICAHGREMFRTAKVRSAIYRTNSYCTNMCQEETDKRTGGVERKEDFASQSLAVRFPAVLASPFTPSDGEILAVLATDRYDKELYSLADARRREYYATDVYLRGLIEISNFCNNDCLYCGIRRSNRQLERYRLTDERILQCCETGYALGYRTFVIQGGEDAAFSDERLVPLVAEVRKRYTDCAVTLSLGERSYESYQKLYDAGANRYLLRHETANAEHYGKLHPAVMSLTNRKECLWNLKRIGYQVGSGFMVGSPFQTLQCLVEDLRFLQELQPAMIGIGPFIAHHQTPFARQANGDFILTLRFISLLRLMFPYALIPATTALGTIDPQGREMGLRAGANVVMPNLSPLEVRKQYELYDNKICTGEEAAECRGCLSGRVESAGYHLVTAVGDVRMSGGL
ncbi:MAG: [FeFe] hydrogenase H-cluster radical SAM maturase HydE [Planctomycetaceae bacterium]|jgi:biotin synthase|nr:[FeFe] hydrogenase H-cluster radical SAM maturase HydE [Planctomycetaceae bacterium]